MESTRPQRFKLEPERGGKPPLPILSSVPLRAFDLLLDPVAPYHCDFRPGSLYLLMDSLDRFEVFDRLYAKF